MNKPKNVILIGRSGSGKGTQAELLQKKFGYFYFLIMTTKSRVATKAIANTTLAVATFFLGPAI